MENLPLLVPLIIIIPLAGFIINIFWGARLGEQGAGLVGVTAAVLAFVAALLMWLYLLNSSYTPVVVNFPFLRDWIRLDSIGVSVLWQMRVDTLSVTMMLVVTGVGSLIHIYAIGYMHGDERFSRFFAYLNLFFVFMLILVTANNFLMMFVGWEGVGLCSYLLIGFWFDRARGVGWRNSNAARKAMIVNRIGDFGLLMAIFLIFATFGTLDFYRPGELGVWESASFGDSFEAEAGEEGEGEAAAQHEQETFTHTFSVGPTGLPLEMQGVFGKAEAMLESGAEVQFGPHTLPIATVIALIAFFMLVGATGKSAQIPLFIWLPDAMAGPTPVSALIHAATMVTAGVYMMVRANVFYTNAPDVAALVAIIGAATALMAGFIALGQWDIKRVLAYSTISQLGFMVAAVGVGAYGAAMFHLVTHAFFKALLFLGSGSVIHGMEHGHHEVGHHDEDFDAQDMRNMGGLRARMPTTYWLYVIGTLALAGIFPLAGFWSKDEILADAFAHGTVTGNAVFVLLILAAGFTAFYMWRQVEMVFHGQPRTEAAAHAHESPPVMTRPLMLLGLGSILAGFINVPANVPVLADLFGAHRFTNWLEATVSVHAGELNWPIAIGATLWGLAAIVVAHSIYGAGRAVTQDGRDPLQTGGLAGVFALSNARLWWDEVYFRLFENPFNRLAAFLADEVDWAFWHDYFHNVVIGKGFNAIGTLLSEPVDLGIVDGAVNGVGRLTQWFSRRLRRVQTGYVRSYAIGLLLGVVLVILILLLPVFQSNG